MERGAQEALRELHDLMVKMELSMKRMADAMESQTAAVQGLQESKSCRSNSLIEWKASEVRPQKPMPLLPQNPMPPAARSPALQARSPALQEYFPEMERMQSMKAAPSSSSHELCSYERSRGLDGRNPEDEKHPNTLRDLEELKATSLRRNSRMKRSKEERTSQLLDVRPTQNPAASPAASPSLARVCSVLVDSPTVMGKQNMETLRKSHDALVMGSKTNLSIGESSFPCIGRFFLCLIGHVRFGDRLASRAWCLMTCGILPLALTALLACATAFASTTKWTVSTALNLCFLQLGVCVASLSFGRNMEHLLGPTEQQLDDYAQERGFTKDWQSMSSRRLLESLGAFLFMLIMSGAVSLSLGEAGAFAPHGFQEHVFFWSWWFMAMRFFLLCYAMMHVACGLELAVDSFTVRFFNEMDLQEALEEWNVLQATLRQVSNKMSDALLAIGFASLASMAILAEHLLSSEVNIEEMLQWLLKFYPLVMFLLLSIVRAAEVTEKASRVAPLVNSWQFESEGEVAWMDSGRQYAVQYISQSMAGFYVKGAQLTAANAQKIFYYFAVVSFALFSRLF